MRNRIVLALAFLFFLVLESGTLRGAEQSPFRDPNEDPTGTGGALKAQIQTGGTYDAYSGNATRVVTDLSVPDAPGEYGLDFTRYWNSNHNDYDDANAEWPLDFGASGWSHSWHWRAELVAYSESLGDGEEELFHTQIIITFPDGHTTKYKIVRSNHGHGIPGYPGGVAPADPRLGPYYTPPEINSAWPDGGMGVHDHITRMDVYGLDFWLTRADGGSVHFVWHQTLGYQAKEVYDPHGLKTTLHYTEDGYLYQVAQEGGRVLNITWGFFQPGGWRVITKVETGHPAGLQRVTYKYTRSSYFLVLSKATYENDPAPGQTTSAYYTYGTCFGEGTEPCSGDARSDFPLLKRADDPRFAGPMTKIRYNYRGTVCPPHLIRPWDFPEWVPAQPYAIAAERSDTGAFVSSFLIHCDGGLREETNGLGANGWGATRKFYFGNSAATRDQTTSPPLFCRGYQLGKVTDFYYGTTPPANLPHRRQNFHFGDPRHIWDGRDIKTREIVNPGDKSGSPSEIHHVGADGSSVHYNRLDESDSEALDQSRMHNTNKRWLFWKRDELGRTTVYKRDSRRRVKEIVYPDTSREFFTYNNFNQIETHTLPSHHPAAHAIKHYQYNGLQQLELEWNTVDNWEARKEYTYDSFGRVLTMTDGVARNASPPAAFTVKMTYNGRHQVTSVEYPPTGGAPSPIVRYEYDNYGNCTVITDEMGHRKEFTYDSYRRCTSYIEWVFGPGPDCNNLVSRRWDWYYDRHVGGVGIPASAHTSKQWWVQVEPVFNSSGHRRVSVQKFDPNDRVIEAVTGMIEASGSWYVVEGTTELHWFTYDKNGQKSSFTDPRLRVTTYDYDLRNRPWKTNEYPYPNTGVPRTTETLYDVAGNKLSVKFPDQQMQHWENYDAFGQPQRFIDERSNATDLIYCWGPMKKLYKVITHRWKDGGGWEDQLTEFGYDLTGRPTQTVFPDQSIEKSTYKYGLLDTFQTRRGQMKRLNYDARGREVSHTWDNGAAPGVSRVWDDAHRLTRISNSFSTIDYSYDDAGQVVTEGTTVAGSGGQTPAGTGVLKQLNYCRYPSGEVARVTYPNGFIVQREYTARGQLQIVRDSSQLELVRYAYHKDGKVEFQDYGNGVRSAFGYNGRGMIDSVHHKRNASGANLSYRDYWRDERDRIVAWKRSTDNSLNGMEDGRGDQYQYDAEGQLKQASYRAVINPEGTPSQAQRTDIFHYDALGNREGSNHLANRGTMSFPRRDNGLNQYAGWMPYSPILYDDPALPARGNGVLAENGWISATYNALNQPMGMWSTAYGSTNNLWFGYDPLGRCVKRWVGPANQPPANVNPATYYYYEGWNLIQEGPSGATADRTYVHGDRVDEIVASQAGGVWNYHQYDARGHCTLLTDTSGGIREQYEYDAFGWPYHYNAAGIKLSAGAQWGNRFLFTGREWLKDLKVYDYRHRMYQPELGRFLQPDPLQFKAGDYNLYRYCHNDPINKTDPDGQIVPAVIIAVIVAGYFLEPEIANAPAPGDRTYGPVGPIAPLVAAQNLTGPGKGPLISKTFNVVRKLMPDPKAKGPHTTFKRDSQTGQVSGHATFDANGNPVQRTDVTGTAHGGVSTPHTHIYGPPNTNPATGQTYPGNEVSVRPAFPQELPKSK
jgi:RHS repeat-associated protein